MKLRMVYIVILSNLFCRTAKAQTDRPNIVFILADDLGATDLGCYGSDFYETPQINRLASQGMRFEYSYSAGANSAPSRACLMTGMYTPRHGIYTVSPSDRGDKNLRRLIPIVNTEDVASSFTTMAESIGQSGYQCAQIGKWHLGDDLEGTGPISQGFNLNIGGNRMGNPHSYFYPYCNKKGSKCMVALEKGSNGEYLTDRLTQEAKKFILKRDQSKPFFLYLSHYAVHTPLTAPQQLVNKYKQKTAGKHHSNPVYAAMIESVDQSVGEISSLLDSLGLSDNTIFIFTSDNGGTTLSTDNFPFRGEKGTPYEGGIRVPLIIRYPAKIKPGTTSDVPVINIDFFPTLTEEAKGKCPQKVDGTNIFELLERKSKKTRDLFWHFPAYLESYKKGGFRATPYSIVRSGDWKLIYFYETRQSELYNVKKDISETRNEASTHASKRKELEQKLFQWLKATHAPIPQKINPDYINR